MEQNQCGMKILEFIFHLGVVFAVFGFLWWIFMAILAIFRGGRSRNEIETYSLKLINYFFLVSVTARFAVDPKFGLKGAEDQTGNIVAGLILLMYLIGKIQKKEQRLQMSMALRGFMQPVKRVFNRKVEVILLFVAIAFFTLFVFVPETSYNPVTNWFVESIINIADTPVFGFIFKVIGFFFLLNVLFRFIGGILQVLGLKSPVTIQSTNFTDFRNTKDSDKSDEDDFDDYEEVK